MRVACAEVLSLGFAGDASRSKRIRDTGLVELLTILTSSATAFPVFGQVVADGPAPGTGARVRRIALSRVLGVAL